MTTSTPLEDQVRHALHTVAETVTERPEPQAAPTEQSRRPRRHWRRWSVIGGAVAIPVLLAAGAYLQKGPEYVDHIPESSIIVKGDVDGDRYLLVETRRTYHRCDAAVPGVELVEEDENVLGSEWNTVGEMYGEGGGDCAPDTSRYLANPALFNDGGTEVGDSFVWLWAVHPDVTAVRVTADGASEELPVHSVDGAGYALYEVPSDVTTWSAELLIGADVVPGSFEEHAVRDR